MLPKNIDKPKVPPIKIQGIKTKLVPFIASSIKWSGCGTYFEPFMGSGVVGFNLEPKRAVFSDTNPHIINFYKDIQDKKITGDIVRAFLESEGKKLEACKEDKTSYYYEVRDRFNAHHNSLDFLFLQRSNFNGMIRFNNRGAYNVPFGRNPKRFNKALITKIVNQVKWTEELFEGKDWQFICMPFTSAFELMKEGDFAYLDPPYIDRYNDYYNSWSNEEASLLNELTQKTEAGYAFSMWYENRYRKNQSIGKYDNAKLLKAEHFYHLGAKESNRNSMVEALIINKDHISKSAYAKAEVLF